MHFAYTDRMTTVDPTAIKAADLQKVEGISKPYSYQLASGLRKPSLTLALRIEAALGVPVSAWPLARKRSA